MIHNKDFYFQTFCISLRSLASLACPLRFRSAGEMAKRAYEADLSEIEADNLAFFDRARDLLAAVIWDDDGATYERQLVKGLRSLMTASRELNKRVVTDSALWEQLLGAMMHSRRFPLTVVRLDRMQLNDLAALSSQALSLDRLMQHDLGVAGEIRGGSPLPPYAETALQLLRDMIERQGYTEEVRRRRTLAPDPMRWWIELLHSVLTRDLDAIVETPFSWYPYTLRFRRAHERSLETKWYGLGSALETFLLRLNTEASVKAQTLHWRMVLRYGALGMQQSDSPLTLVPLEQLPVSYNLFWFVLLGRRSPPDAPQRHRMFHACVTCQRTLDSETECCWLPSEPLKLYCNAECFVKHH